MSTDPRTEPESTPRTSGPILAPGNASPALASRPDDLLTDGRWHVYESHPVPWWVAALWVGFFVFAIVYLITNLVD